MTGTAGSSGTGRGGTTRHGRHGRHDGTGGTAGTGGTGGTTARLRAPIRLPETQSASDHTHTVTIAASTLNATTAQTFTTSTRPAHTHMVTLEPAQLTTLKGGGTSP